jgi:tetratricopeptide (TPR) repeat protein
VKKSEPYAAVLQGLGMFQWWTNDLPRGIELLEDSLKLFHQFKNKKEEVNVSTELSRLYHTADNHVRGIECSKRSHDLAINIGNPALINSCLSFVCMSHIFLKQYDEALPMAKEGIAASEKLEQPDILVRTHHFFSDCALGTGDFKEAEKRYALTVKTAMQYRNLGHGAIDLQGVAFALSGQKRWAKAIRLFAAASEYAKSLGLDIGVGFWGEWTDLYIGNARKALGEEFTRKYEEEGISMGHEKAVQYALDFEID